MAYSVITDDNFTRANTTAGTVTGPATYNSPSTGAAYTDVKGSTYYISSNVLTNTGEVNGDFSVAYLLRPSSENVRDGQVAVTGITQGGGSNIIAVDRYVAGTGAYCASLYGGSTLTFSIGKLGVTSNTFTSLASQNNISGSGTAAYVVTLSASGVSPTTLTATLALASSPTTIIATLNASDSTSALQVAGQKGLSSNNYNGTTANIVTFSRLVTSALTTTGANIISTPTSATVVPGGTQTFNIGLDGTLANGITTTVNLSSNVGMVSPSTLTFTGNGSTPATQAVTFTAQGTAANGTLTSTNSQTGGTQALNNLSAPITVAASALAIGAISATVTASQIAINLAASASGGSGAGYVYKLYRGTDPNFAANSGSLLSTPTSFPYVDTTAVFGVDYWYGLTVTDSAGTVMYALPAGLGTYASPPAYIPYVGANLNKQGLIVCCIGDSITYGQNLSNAGTNSSPTMPFYLQSRLKKIFGNKDVIASNQGHSGHTLYDFRNGGSDYTALKSAMATLIAANPTYQVVFSIMLGGNDSASAGTNNGIISTGTTITGACTPAQFQANLQSVIAQLLSDYPTAKVIAHKTTCYSPNWHNTATYEQPGVSLVYAYRPVTDAAVASFATSNPGQVFVGDTYAFDYFLRNYQTELQPESVVNGVAYVHPTGSANGTTGQIGTESLATFHAQAIAQTLYGAGGSGSISYTYS